MKQSKFPFGVLLSAMLVVGMLFSFLYPKKGFSAAENRSLQTRPSFSETGLLDGSFQKTMEQYLSDQFPGRDRWMSLRSDVMYLSNARQIDDVYITEDGRLLRAFKVKDTIGEENLSYINRFAENHSECKHAFMLVPDAIAFYGNNNINPAEPSQSDQYQKLSKMLDQKIRLVDVWKILSQHKNEDIYFRSDHHWTAQGALYGAEQLVEKEISGFHSVIGNHGFYGSLARSAAWYHEKDVLELLLPDKPLYYTVCNLENKEVKTSLYEPDALKKADPYTVFFGGNFPALRIDTANANGKKLLIVKDSYANALVPYLIEYYEKIVIVDPRYYYDDLSSLMKSEGINQTLFLFSMNTFFQDDSLQTLLREQKD